jgi:DNA repair protein RadD
MNPITLRDYQARAVTEVLQKLNEGVRRVLLVAPTGAGKTRMGAALVQDLVSSGLRVLWIAHRIELVEQAIASLGIPCGVIVAGSPPGLGFLPCVVASLQTLVRRLDTLDRFDVVFIDEAHHATSASYRAVVDALPKAKVLGLTATPTRLDGRGLVDVFDCMIEAASTSRLVADGHLVRAKVFSHPTQPDLSAVKMTGGDFNEQQLDAACNRADLRGDVVEHWMARAAGLPTVLFAVSIAHSKALIDDFGKAGVVAVHVDGKMPRKQRDRALEAVRAGEAHVLCNVGIVTEGWDMPALRVCILARPTASLSLLLQMWGRVMRPDEGKSEALVLDHAGNVLRHGILPHQDVQWRGHFSGELRKKRKGRKKALAPSLAVKQCPTCYAVNAAAVSRCAECGYEWPVETKTPETDKNTQLVEITDEVLDLVRSRVTTVAKPSLMAALEAAGVTFTIGGRGSVQFLDPNGAVSPQVAHALSAQKREIKAYMQAQNPSAYVKGLMTRIQRGKVPEAFLELVRKHRGNLSAASHHWQRTTGRWV